MKTNKQLLIVGIMGILALGLVFTVSNVAAEEETDDLTDPVCDGEGSGLQDGTGDGNQYRHQYRHQYNGTLNEDGVCLNPDAEVLA